MKKNVFKLATLSALIAVSAGCSNNTAVDYASNPTAAKLMTVSPESSQESVGNADFVLEIMHVNDVHSYIDPAKVSLKTPIGMVRVKVGGPEAIKTVINTRRKANPDLIFISAGDQITGNASNYDTFHGEADAALYGMYNTDFYVLGNHEFDHGGKAIATFMDFMKQKSPNSILLNSDLTVGPESPVKDTGTVESFKEIGGHNIAFYGVTTGKKIQASSSPDSDMVFKETIPTINELTAKNKDKAKIHVLVTHQGVIADRTNAPLLNDVDIIIGGDSHSLCGNFSDYGFKGECTYPMTRVNASGHKICIVQANEYGKIIGDLKVSFDKDGNVLKCEGSPFMPIWTDSAVLKDPKTRNQIPHQDVIKAVKDIIADPKNSFIEAEASSEATEAMNPYRQKIKEKYSYLGEAKEDLCTTRYPTDDCFVKNAPNPYGSETCTVFAQVYLDGTDADIFLGNSGMFRVDIEEGEFTDADLLAVTPFSNEIKELRMTGKEISQVLNQTIRYIQGDPSSRDGGTPCGYGFTYAIQPGNNPVTDIKFVDRKGNQTVMNPNKTYKVLTTDYLLRGKDGFVLFKKKKAINLIGTDSDLIRKYLKNNGSLPKLPENIKTISSFRE